VFTNPTRGLTDDDGKRVLEILMKRSSNGLC
jgi:hypothetical protein